MDFPKKQQQCLIPRYLLQYLQDLQISHNDPTAPWGGGGGTYTAGIGIDITNDVISLDTTPETFEITASTGITLMAENQNPLYKDAKLILANSGSTRLEGTDVSIEANSIHFNSDNAPWYVNNTTHEYKVLATTDQIPSLAGYATEDWVSTELLNYAELSDLATVATSGNYNDLTNKPNLANYVTTNTNQNITGVKTIYDTSNGHSDIYFKAPLNDNNSNTMGFSAFDYNNRQIGGLQVMNRTLQFNSDESSTYYYGTFLTNFRNNINSLNTVTGFRVLPSDRDSGSYSINFVAPFGTQSDLYNIYKSNSNVNTVNLVAAVTDGTNTVLANKLGVVDISSLVSGGGTTVSGTNDGTNWTSITIGSDTYGIPSSGGGGTTYIAGDGIDITNDTISIDNTVALKSDIPSTSNFVNLTGVQNITGEKTFVGAKKLGFKKSSASDVIGFTAYDNNNYEIGNLQIANRTVGSTTYNYVTLGNYSTQNTKSKLGFRVQPNSSSSSFNFVMPYGTQNDFTSNGYYTNSDTTFPFAFTDGTTIVKADATGLVNISSISGGGGSSGPTVTRYTGYLDYSAYVTGSQQVSFYMYSSTLDNYLNIENAKEGDYVDITVRYSWGSNYEYESFRFYIPAKASSSSASSSTIERRMYNTNDKETYTFSNPYSPTQATSAADVFKGSYPSYPSGTPILTINTYNRNVSGSTYGGMSAKIMAVDYYSF